MSQNYKSALIFIFVTLLVYGNTFFNGWTFDDLGIVTDPASMSFNALLQLESFDRALRFLTHIPEYKLFGLNPIAYRPQQLFWHAANGFLLYQIIKKFGVAEYTAIFSTLLFLIHPLQTESVASIGHRKELLAMFFILSSFLAYLNALQNQGKIKYILLSVSLFTFVIALSANLTILTFPVILICYELLMVSKNSRVLTRNIPVLCTVTLAALFLLTYHWRDFFSYSPRLLIYSQNLFFENYQYYPLFWGVIKAFGIYVSHIFFPLNLTPEYTLKFSNEFFPISAIPGLICLLLLIYIPFHFRQKNRLLAFSAVWFIAFYLPVSNFVPAGYIVADRYMYVCLPAFSLAIGALNRSVSKQQKYGFIILIILAGLTIRQNAFWKNPETLWEHAVSVCPTSTGAHILLADTYLKNGKFSDAKTSAQTAKSLNPFLPYPYYILGMLALRENNFSEAREKLQYFIINGKTSAPDKYNEAIRILQKLGAPQ